MKYDVSGQWRSNKINILSKNILFIGDFCLRSNIIKTLYECQHYEDTKFHKMKYDLKGHKRQPLCYYFGTFHLCIDFDENLYECQYYLIENFHWMKNDFMGHFMLCSCFVIVYFLTFGPNCNLYPRFCRKIGMSRILELYCHLFIKQLRFSKNVNWFLFAN